jgi:ABC-type multidrug transport system fused ATPase/permease subunit
LASSTVAINAGFVMKKVEYGNHRELREKKGFYDKMYSAQKKLVR